MRGASAAGVAVALLWGVQGAAAFPDVADLADPNLLLFSGTDIWRHGMSAHSGIRWSPNGIDWDGFTIKLMSNSGLYTYRSSRSRSRVVLGRQLGATILPGWRFQKGPLIVSAFAGFDYQQHYLMPNDPGASLRGWYWGVRGAVEVWYEPTARTMVTLDASASTIGADYAVRGAAGLRLFDWFYIGPEIGAFSSNGNYRQARAGVHVTGLKFMKAEWSAGVGWGLDSDGRNSLYARLGVLSLR